MGGEDPANPKKKQKNNVGIPHFTGGSFPDFTSCRPPGGRGLGPQPHPLVYKAHQGGIQRFYFLWDSGFQDQGVTPQKGEDPDLKSLVFSRG